MIVGRNMRQSTLHVEDQGTGSPALVFLHYFAGSLQSWAHVSGRLANTCRCLRIDLPGFGRSPPLASTRLHRRFVVARVGLRREQRRRGSGAS